jgi:predicted RNA-binding Zn-ribbon protein involved in translation (DUF1610 family)
MDTREVPLDGNAAAGLLSAIFVAEVTTVRATCGGCGAERPVAELLAYSLEMGAILRCPDCGEALIRVGHVAGGYCLDLRGAGLLWIPAGA